ncbi:unnamed protein product, partial [marine sediment metagenome]
MEIKDKILKGLQDNNVRFINFQFSDIFGHVKSTTKPAQELEESLERGIWFDGSSIEGFARIQESDSLLKPDLDTFAVIPWSPENSKEARFICDVYVPAAKGWIKPFEGDPRYILKKQCEKANEMGFSVFNVGPE